MTPAARRAMVALLFFGSGCGDPGAARLQGHWRGVHAEGVPAESTGSANAFASALAIDVKGDVMTVTQGTRRQTGRYRVVQEDASRVVLTTDADGPLDPYTFVFVDEDMMRWEALPGRTLVFARQ